MRRTVNFLALLLALAVPAGAAPSPAGRPRRDLGRIAPADQRPGVAAGRDALILWAHLLDDVNPE
jgi:hypothetical protein